MIDPAGDAANVGRKLVEGYERGVSLQFAEKLRSVLVSRYGIQVVLTRSPREIIPQLQNASFANRLNIDFFLSLHLYHQEEAKPNLFIYHLLYNPMVDLVTKSFNPLLFVPIHQAHFGSIAKTILLANMMKTVLTSESYKKRLNFYGPFGLPLKPLVGIMPPAVIVEVGICEESNWKHLVDPLAESLEFLKTID